MIIAGFAGVGKTTFCNKHKNAIDFVAMPFKYENFNERYAECGAESVKADYDLILKTDWRYEYYDALLKTQEEYPDEIIVIPPDRYIMRWLVAECIPFTLVYPCMEAKEEYRKRFVERGNTEDFLDVFIGEWDSWIEMMQEQEADVKIELQPNQFLSDVIIAPECTECITDRNAYINEFLQKPPLKTRKDTLLSDLELVAVHKTNGKRIAFTVGNLSTSDYEIYIDKDFYFDDDNVEDIYLDFSEDSEYGFRLSRPGENERGLIRPMCILMAEAQTDGKLLVLFKDLKEIVLDLRDFLSTRAAGVEAFDFNDFETTDTAVCWKNTNIKLTCYQIKHLIRRGKMLKMRDCS